MQQKPLVSIGMPVYNGESSIQEALESLLAQDYTNFELLISDNASVDKTQEICMSYASRDNRIKYYRNDKNLGAMPNFSKVLDISHGSYFMWAAHDDLWESKFISTLVNHLISNQNIVLIMSETQYKLPHGVYLPFFSEGKGFYTVKDNESKLERLLKVVNHNYGNLIYGLYRKEALFKGSGKSIISDVKFINENPVFIHVASIGSIAVIPEILFYKTPPSISTYLCAAREYNFSPKLNQLNSFQENDNYKVQNLDFKNKVAQRKFFIFIKRILKPIKDFIFYFFSIAQTANYHYKAFLDIRDSIYDIDAKFHIKSIVLLAFATRLTHHYLKVVFVWKFQDICSAFIRLIYKINVLFL